MPQDRRTQLNNILTEILGSDEVYFQPGPSVEIKYPAIKYYESSEQVKYADNQRYTLFTRYRITLLDYDPDSPLLKEILNRFMYARLDSTYKKDNLNCFTINLYW